MKAYVLECGEFDDKTVYGLYSTKDKAEQVAKEYGYEVFTITEFNIDDLELTS